MNVIIGIDNGLDGGIAAISRFNGAILALAPMPTLIHILPPLESSKDGAARERREVDTVALIALLDNMCYDRSKTHVIFEECPDHAKRASSMRSMAISTGKVTAALEVKGFSHNRIMSRDWHPLVLGTFKKGQSKVRAEATARLFWPNQVWPTLKPKGRKLHDGIIDALLIAHYGRITA